MRRGIGKNHYASSGFILRLQHLTPNLRDDVRAEKAGSVPS
jgi:hypothetical protein